MSSADARPIKSDVLAVWYFRLNGVFTIPNFVLHPQSRGSARTDADVAGIRYPFRAEFSGEPGLDESWFESHAQPCAILAEVKTSECAINGPWSNPEAGNIDQVLSDLGWCPPAAISSVASTLYTEGVYSTPSLTISLFCVGNSESVAVRARYPKVPQRTWSHITSWIFERFTRYRRRKKDHDQWDSSGQALWTLFEEARGSEGRFEAAVRQRFLLPVA